MKKLKLPKWKIAGSLACLALLILASSTSAALVVTGAYQNPGTSSFDPTVTWTVAANSLIHGLSPSGQAGNFTGEGNTPGVSALTDGTIGPVSGSLNIYAAGGPSAGTQVTYTLPAQTYGYNLTNITVYSGWANGGRSAQGYTVLYSTVANPTTFIYLTNVTYTAGFSGNNPGTPITLQVQLADSAGGVIAANVAQVEFLFSWPTAPNGENSGSGYSEITVQGTPAANVVSPVVSITTSNQSGASPFTPSWTAETPDLILGMTPSTASGTFTLETSGGTPVLTDGTIGTSGTHSTLATCGANGGTTLIYTLTNVVNGTDVTNIITYSGWGDSGRDGQYYIVSYATIAAPNAFIPITTVYYLPSFPNPAPANRVAIAMNNGSALASGVAKIKFDFSSPAYANSFNNAYQGYSEIIVQGHDTATPPPPPSPLLTQDILPSYAATITGDQVVFTATYSNFPPVSLQWQQVVTGPVTNNISTGVVNVTNNNVVTSTLTLNNVQVNSSGTYRLQGLNATNGAAAPSYSSGASLVVSSTPAAVGNIIFETTEQLGLGAIGLVNLNTNFYPTWTVNTANDLILNSTSGSGLGTFVAGSGNFDMNIPVYGTGAGPLDPDPTILSDGSGGYLTYWPSVGGNFTQCSCGTGGAGDTMTYTLNTSLATYGFDITNITIYGGWGDAGRNEQKYEVLYSTVANPTVFTSLGIFDYNPTDPSGLPTATRTMLIPVSGALAQNVAQVEINWNVASAPKNNWEGYSEVVVQGVQSLNYPILLQDTLPATAATVVGDQITFAAAFSNAPAASLQWQFINTNGIVSDITGATTATLTLNNLQLTNTGSYQLKAVSIANSAAISYSTAAPLTVNAVPAPVGNIILTTANQTFLGAVSGVNLSTNYTPTWTENTNNDLILGATDSSAGSPPGDPGTVWAGGGNYAPSGSACNGDPVILSDGSIGYLNYWPGIGGNSTLDACGNSAGFSVTYTLPASATNGWSLTNITVYGGWGSNGRDELKYEVLYSTISAPTTFNHLISVDYNPAGGSPNLPSASRTTLVPAAGAMAQSVYAVEFNFFNAASGSENGWSGYSEIVVAGQPSPPVPVLTTNVTPTTAEDVVGSSLTLTANFSGADSFQWLKNGTNLPGATSPTLTLKNLKLSDMATNSGYSLVASNSSGTNMTTFCKVFVDPAPAAVSNIVTAIAYQTSTTAGFTPTWDTTMLGLSLIAGQNPPIIDYDQTGNFQDPDTGVQAHNLAGGLPVLTDGNYGAFDNTGAHPAFATCGPGGSAPGAGQYVIYQLGNYTPSANGYDITNIQIAGGWNDNGRNSQYYTVSYSTVANPTLFFPMIVEANNLSSGNALGGGTGEAVPAGAGIPTTVRTTFTPASGLLASNVYAIYVDYTVPNSVPNGYSGYSEISVFGSPSATAPLAGPVITTQHEEYTDSFTLETPNLIANQLPSSYGPGIFTEEGCSEAGLTDGVLSFGGDTNSASCGDDGIAVPWIVFTPTNGSWNLTNIVVYTLWHDYGRDGQFYNVSYSTLSSPTTFLPLASVAYNPFVIHDGRASGNRVEIAPPVGQAMLATNVAALKFDFTPQGVQDFGWSGYTEIILQGTNLPSTVVTAPILGAPKVSGGNLILTGTGGTPGAGYTWLTTTNLASPILWTTNSTGNLDGAGAFSNSIPIGASPDRFFRLRLP
jgi:hypothetical protein